MSDDLTIVLLILAVGLFPLAAAISRGSSGRNPAIGFGLILLSLVGFLEWSARMQSRPRPAAAPQGVPEVVREDAYVGSDTCMVCHPYEHATWHASYHRTMTQVAGPESILAPFDETVLHLEGVTWRVYRKGDEFWVTGKDDAQELSMRVAMVTGSHNYQVYWLEPYGQAGLQQFPFVYFLYDRIWVPRKSRFLQPPMERTPLETGRWKSHCIRCHATRGRKEHEPGGEARVAELGISCEACHGPGGDHVAANRSPVRRYSHHLSGKPDPTIVNPRRLAHDRATEVCGHCHGIEIFLDSAKAQDWARDGSRYRPGDELAKHQTTVIGRYEDNPPEVRAYLDNHASFRLKFCFWSDGKLRVTGREYHGMLETPCYQRGEMSCLSCHTLHRSEDDPRSFQAWADDQLGADMEGDAACLQCHEQFEDTEELTAHTYHAVDSEGSRCYNCHMPHTTWGLLRAIRSHTVESPSVASSLATGRPNGCNQCHLDQTLAWTAVKLEEWYGIEPPEMSEDEKDTAASVLWTLRGDAGQRALMAWSMGWKPAREISGTGWMVPYLTALLRDPYHAVRFNAQRSLRSYPAYADVAVDAIEGATEDEQHQMAREILADWERSFPESVRKREARLLFRPDGKMDTEKFRRLAEQRDNEILVLFE